MNSRIRLLGAIAGVCIAMPAFAGDSAALKCAGSQDRVWLYDSLVTFEVQAKLKCGETVEILSREKAFVKIRTQNGAEGYVPEVALPKPQTAEVRDEKPAAELSLAEQARAARAARNPTPSASAPVAVAAVRNNERAPEPKVSVAREQPSESVQPVAATSNSLNAVSITASAVETSARSSDKPTASQPAPSTAVHSGGTSSRSPDSSAPKTPLQKSEKTAASKSKTTQPPPSKPVRPPAAPSSSTSSASNVAPAAPSGGQHSVVMASASVNTAPRTVTAVETSSITLRSEPIATTRTVAATMEPESEDYPERVVEDESANASCETYFSAYGLSPMQYKWMVENRRKKYPGICPASAPGTVDFVVILTHDVAFYNSTMPTPVRTDKNGFSDWNPMTRADDTVVSASELDKSKHEYVWVFQMKRGAFDPAKFSPRRRPQFTKAESNGLGSHAAPRSMEDAFQFMQSAPAR
jgi:hypothetical protein